MLSSEGWAGVLETVEDDPELGTLKLDLRLVELGILVLS